MPWGPAQLAGFGPDSGRYFQREGLRLHYRDNGGEGRPVVLIHGVNQNHRTWELVVPRLKGSHRLIAVDQRGHGRSEQAGQEYKRGDLVADLEALVATLRLQRPVVVGHSLGAWVGMQFAAAHAGALAGLVVGDMAPNVGGEMDRAGKASMEAALAPGVGDASWADEEEAYAALRKMSPTEGEYQVRARIRQQLRLRADGRLERARSPQMARAILEEVWTTDLWPLLPRITCPTLVVRAEFSDVLPAEVARRMVEELPDARLAEVEGSYHNLQLFKPEEFGDLVAEFLADLG